MRACVGLRGVDILAWGNSDDNKCVIEDYKELVRDHLMGQAVPP